MKIIYTILFFLDAVLLITLSFLLLKFIDKGEGSLTIISMLAAIIFSILLLVYFLYAYLKIPPGNTNR